jgi:hypothetical protein
MAASMLSVTAVLCGCSGSPCANTAIDGAPSPDGAAIAFVFHRNCGGAVTTHVSVQAFSQALRNDAGNVLAAAGEQPIKISWRGARTLKVSGVTGPLYEHPHPTTQITVEFP